MEHDRAGQRKKQAPSILTGRGGMFSSSVVFMPNTSRGANTRDLSVPRKRARPRKAKAGRSEAAAMLVGLRWKKVPKEVRVELGRQLALVRWGKQSCIDEAAMAGALLDAIL